MVCDESHLQKRSMRSSHGSESPTFQAERIVAGSDQSAKRTDPLLAFFLRRRNDLQQQTFQDAHEGHESATEPAA